MASLRQTIAPALAALTLVLAACTAGGTDTGSAPTGAAQSPAVADVDTAALDATALADMGAVELIDTLDRTPIAQRPQGVMASIRPGEVLVGDQSGGQPISVPLPEGTFYLSMAPFVNRTHECFFHSLTTCTGELGSAPVTVKITDTASGEVLVDESTTTFENGFIGYWLPAGITAEVSIGHDGRSGTATVRTGPEDLTCLSSLRLV